MLLTTVRFCQWVSGLLLKYQRFLLWWCIQLLNEGLHLQLCNVHVHRFLSFSPTCCLPSKFCVVYNSFSQCFATRLCSSCIKVIKQGIFPVICNRYQLTTDRHTADTQTTDTWTGRLFLDFPHWSLSASLYFCTQQGSETQRNSLWWNSWIRMTWKRTLKKIST